MKKALSLIAVSLLLALAGCGGGEETLSVTLRSEGTEQTEFHVDVFDAEGRSLGTLRMQEGKNTLPKSCLPAYLVCDVPESLDCPVVYADGNSSVTLTVQAAELSQEEGYLHTFTVHIAHADEAARYRLQMCRVENGELGYCKTAAFSENTACLSLSDGEYELELFNGGDVVRTERFSFRYDSARYRVFDLNEE